MEVGSTNWFGFHMLGTHRFHGTGLLPINEWLVFTFFFVWSLVGKYTSHMGSNLHRDTQDVYSTIPLKQVFCTRKRQWLQSAAATDLHNLQLPSFVWWFPIRMWPHHQFPLYIQGHLLRYGTLGVPKRPYPCFFYQTSGGYHDRISYRGFEGEDAQKTRDPQLLINQGRLFVFKETHGDIDLGGRGTRGNFLER